MLLSNSTWKKCRIFNLSRTSQSWPSYEGPTLRHIPNWVWCMMFNIIHECHNLIFLVTNSNWYSKCVCIYLCVYICTLHQRSPIQSIVLMCSATITNFDYLKMAKSTWWFHFLLWREEVFAFHSDGHRHWSCIKNIYHHAFSSTLNQRSYVNTWTTTWWSLAG